jgi:hypothetical protein
MSAMLLIIKKRNYPKKHSSLMEMMLDISLDTIGGYYRLRGVNKKKSLRLFTEID